MLCDAIDLLSDVQLEDLLGAYVQLEPLRAREERQPGLLEAVRAFDASSRARDYYDSFDVNSKNFTQLSKGTRAFIFECERLAARCPLMVEANVVLASECDWDQEIREGRHNLGQGCGA